MNGIGKRYAKAANYLRGLSAMKRKRTAKAKEQQVARERKVLRRCNHLFSLLVKSGGTA